MQVSKTLKEKYSLENKQKLWQKCWEISPEMHILLKESSTVDEAREKIIHYITSIDWSYRRDLADDITSWDYIALKEAVRCFTNIITPRNERLAHVSSLLHLWTAAREGDSDVSVDFIHEFFHLFSAIKGKSEIYTNGFITDIHLPDFDTLEGRPAGIARSNYLDELAQSVNNWLKIYSTGLIPEVIERRHENRKRILNALDGYEDDWFDWKWQFRKVFKDIDDLDLIKQLVHFTTEEEEGIRLALENGIPFGITPYYLHLMDIKPSDNDFAIRRQVISSLDFINKTIQMKDDLNLLDFMRERDTSPIDLITRRYPLVCIIKPYDSCPQICVYCQRNWEIKSPFVPGAMAPQQQLDDALDWLANHDGITDVLITGGDPLVMSDDRIESILKFLTELDHISSIRLATRIPVTVPMRITTDLCEMVSSYQEINDTIVYFVTHVSHPYEITPEMKEALLKIRKQGISTYNQQVFTFGNSRRFETAALRIGLKKIGIDPYYIFNMKGKSEMADYAVPVARILQERKEEARLLPGIYRTDEPVFNVPFLGKNHLHAWQDHELISILPDGRRMYSFHPWEKNIAKIKPYLYTDVTIQSYLDKLEKRGDDPNQYRSIWYYY
ncbi:MAG: KamA family radical SAM protein [Candidatus Kariarchaeaceae archaeon]